MGDPHDAPGDSRADNAAADHIERIVVAEVTRDTDDNGERPPGRLPFRQPRRQDIRGCARIPGVA